MNPNVETITKNKWGMPKEGYAQGRGMSKGKGDAKGECQRGVIQKGVIPKGRGDA